ncbi:MAG: DUF374 domain-containing protein [Candidatus Methylacidiphilales bacterium]
MVLALWGRTLRMEFVDAVGERTWSPDEQALLAFWHNRILALPPFYARFLAHRPIYVMISLSRDGQWISDIIRWFGLRSVRGSSSRHAVRAGKEMLDTLAVRGNWGAVTPDGPRGPRYSIGPGLIQISALSGVPVVPLRVEAEKKWELRSWDRFQIPYPFSRVRFTCCPAIRVPPDPTEETCRELAEQVAAALGRDA